MALFSRRCLWQALQRNASFVSNAHLKHWIGRLDTIRQDYVSAEWEIVLVDVLSRFGVVQYEPDTTNRVDVVFRDRDSGFAFAADIATAFDWALHKSNPVDALAQELGTRLRKAGMHVNKFYYEVGESETQKFNGRGCERKLLLPHVSRIRPLIFGPKWHEFLREVRNNPIETHAMHVHHQSPPVRLLIKYNPRQEFFTGSYGDYTTASQLRENRLYQSLDKKAKDLRAGHHQTPLGIILCDGGCNVLTARPSWATYSHKEILTAFFQKHRHIDFVAILAVKSHTRLHSMPRNYYECRPAVFLRSSTSFDGAKLDQLITNVCSGLPKLQNWPGGIFSDLKWHDRRNTVPYIGGWQFSGSHITLSARTVLELLSGRLSQNRFLEEHSLPHSHLCIMLPGLNKRLANVNVQYQPEEDDDLIRFEFVADQQNNREIIAKEQTKYSSCATSVITIPASDLLTLIAGTETLAGFLRKTNQNPNENFFADRLQKGELIREARLSSPEPGGGACITLSFGPDPAISSFRRLRELHSTSQ